MYVLYPGAVISSLVSQSLVKVFLCMNNCSNGSFFAETSAGKSYFAILLMSLPSMVHLKQKSRHVSAQNPPAAPFYSEQVKVYHGLQDPTWFSSPNSLISSFVYSLFTLSQAHWLLLTNTRHFRVFALVSCLRVFALAVSSA
ncbi:hCG2036884 [Homo sapiens]|nr:hCG2036884 [Homo sapiens]